MNASSHVLHIGATIRDEPVGLTPDDRARHLYLVGKTGTGKSSLLLNLIIQDMHAGQGVALLDPHGDLAQALLAHVPRHRTNDLVYINPADIDRPIGFNPLSGAPDLLKPVVADGIVAAFRHVWPDSWGPRLDYILTNAVRALLDAPGATLLMLPRFLIDDTFRTPLVTNHVRDELIRAYWLFEYAGYSPQFRTEAIAPIQNKIGKALMTPILRNIVAQPKRTITPRRLMDEGAIVICNLSKGEIGESAAHLFGALFVTALAQAALSRADTPQEYRRPFHLYADEFQSFATDSFSVILSEARKYALTLTLAHQFLDQLSPTLQSAVLGNVGSIVACRLGADDADRLAAQIGLGNSGALSELPNFAAWAQLLRENSPTSPTRLVLYPPIEPLHSRRPQLIALSRQRFGRSRAAIEERIARFFRRQYNYVATGIRRRL